MQSCSKPGEKKKENQTFYFIATKLILVLPTLKSVPRNSKGPETSSLLSASTINSISGTSCTHPLSIGENNCRIATEFLQYLVTLLRLVQCLQERSISRWNKCSIKLHYFSDRTSNYDSVDKSGAKYAITLPLRLCLSLC